MASIQTFHRRAHTIKIIHIWHGKKWELGIFLGITLMIELKKKNGKKWELGIFLGITLMIEI